MDKMDHLLKHLPRPEPAADLAMRVRATVRRRHVRRVWFRHVASVTFGLSGLFLSIPDLTRFMKPMSASGVPWLAQSLGLFQTEASASLTGLWNGFSVWQAALQSALILPLCIGLVLMTLGLFLGLDRSIFQSPLNFNER
jgi:hypothetical protein